MKNTLLFMTLFLASALWGNANRRTDAARGVIERFAGRALPIDLTLLTEDDYSARVWSGLVRDYYLPRRKHYFAARRSGRPFDFATWKRHRVEQTPPLSPARPYRALLEACRTLPERAARITPALLCRTEGLEIGLWTPADVSAHWQTLSWNVPAEKLTSLRGVCFRYERGANKLEIKEVMLEVDGRDVQTIVQAGETGLTDRNNVYRLAVPDNMRGNNSCRLRATVRSDGRCESYGRVLLLCR